MLLLNNKLIELSVLWYNNYFLLYLKFIFIRILLFNFSLHRLFYIAVLFFNIILKCIINKLYIKKFNTARNKSWIFINECFNKYFINFKEINVNIKIDVTLSVNFNTMYNKKYSRQYYLVSRLVFLRKGIAAWRSTATSRTWRWP